MKKILTSIVMTTLAMSSFASIATAATTGSSTVVTTKKSASAADVNSNGASVTIAPNVACGPGTACKVVRDTSTEAIDLINKNAASDMTNVVTSKFDFTLMTKYAMGSNWKSAKPDQQAKLVSLFKQLLIYTYSAALSKFKGARTNIISATVSTLDPDKPDIQKAFVVSQVTLPSSGNNNPIKVEYDLANNTGDWRAYDIKIENASLVTTYRTQFNDVVQNNKIPGLIKQLQDKVDSLQKARGAAAE